MMPLPRCCRRLLLLSFVLLPCFYWCSADVMNVGGIPYSISNPANSEYSTEKYSVDFDTGEGKVEHFDVYGEIQTLYSQVYWTRNTPIDLPPAIVERFRGKVIAITGYEVDQVTHSGASDLPQKTVTDGVQDNLAGFACYPDCSDTDVSVPAYNAYNHHYFAWLTGADAEVVDMDGTEQRKVQLPNPTKTVLRTKKGAKNNGGFPTSIVFKENPGGEFRKSYHGYPEGYAQLLHSPTQWIVEPMQIDTHNRAYNLTDDTVGYQEWFLPAMDMTNDNITQRKSGLCPLIECPCTDRITKSTKLQPSIKTAGVCETDISSLADCQATANATGATIVETITVNDPSKPSGCLISPVDDNNIKMSQEEPSYQYKLTFNAAQRSDDVECGSSTGNELSISWSTSNNVLAGSSELGGLVNISIGIDQNGTATIALTGPADVWSGVGFNAGAMKDEPYAIIVDGSGAVTERKLANHGPGVLLTPSIEVKSSKIVNGGAFRQVVLARPIQNSTSAYYNFPEEPGDIDMIAAVGSTTELSYHTARAAGLKVTLLPTTMPACICEPQTKTYMTYMDSTSFEFHYDCLDEPRSNMLRHGDGTGRPLANAACNMETYHGGLMCCHHGFFLTDRKQDEMIPREKVDTYYLKWRYYFQEYTPAVIETTTETKALRAMRGPTRAKTASHLHLHHWVFLIDADVNDYEEDNAQYGTPSIGSITAHLQAKDMGLEDVPDEYTGITSIVMTPHCHAPSCIREELWNADTNELVCNVTVHYGSDQYGPTIAVFNEANYIAIPPCLFGHQPGLQAPFTFRPDTNLTAIKYFNNTYRHLGQMAQWTGLMVYESSSDPESLVPFVRDGEEIDAKGLTDY